MIFRTLTKLFKGGKTNAYRTERAENVGLCDDGGGVHRFTSCRESAMADCRRIEMLAKAFAIQRSRAPDWRESDQVRGLIAAAQECDELISPEQISGFGRQISKRTGESEVYWHANSASYYKLKDPLAKQPIKRCQCEDWLFEHILHNVIFPETRYEFVGIAAIHHSARIVLRQAAIRTEARPTQRQIDEALASKGLFLGERFFYENTLVGVTDISEQSDNVLMTDQGEIRFIDPLIRLKRPATEIIELLTTASTAKP